MIGFIFTMAIVFLAIRAVWVKEAEIDQLKRNLALENVRYEASFKMFLKASNDLDNLRRQAPKSADLTDGEIKRLIHLCHPDKHNNSKVSVEMTKKLLAMKGG